MFTFSAASTVFGQDDVIPKEQLEIHITTFKLVHKDNPNLAIANLIAMIHSKYSEHCSKMELALANRFSQKEQAFHQKELALMEEIHQKELALKERKLVLEHKESEVANLKAHAHTLQKKAEILQQQLNDFKMLEPDFGTKTKAEFYKGQLSRGNCMRSVPIREVPTDPTSQVAIFANRQFPKEEAMYSEIQELLATKFSDFNVSDTHRNPYLDSRAPDITISRAGAPTIHPIYIHTLVELKRPEGQIDHSTLGQGLDQLYRLAKHQPWRHSFTMLVTNLTKNHFLQIRRARSGSMQFTEFVPVGFETAIDYLGQVLFNRDEQPELPSFSTELGTVERVLGSTKHSIVAEFEIQAIPHVALRKMPQEGRLTIAVKCSRNPGCLSTIAEEIELLRQLNETGGHQNVAKIVYFHPMKQEFGMEPVGEPALPSVFNSNQSLARDVCREILSAIIWLHERNIVHRDIRWDNIVLHEDSAVLIDFGTAIDIGKITCDVQYEGGYICCPPRLLCNLNALYRPQKSDDYHAYLLLLNSVLFPKSMVGFHSARIQVPTSNESKRLLDLWAELTKSLFWQTYVQAAVDGDIAVLKRLPEMIVMLRRETTFIHGASVGSEISGIEQQLGSLGLGVESSGSSICGAAEVGRG